MVVNVDDLLKKQVRKPRFVPKSERLNRKAVTDVKTGSIEKPNRARPAILQNGQRNKLSAHVQVPSWREQRESELAQVQNIDQSEPVEPSTNWSSKALAEMTERDWNIMQRELGISSTADTRPLRSWEELDESIAKVVRKLGYFEPSPIQRAAIPVALQRSDVVGVAETGSGKTASFIIPILLSLQSSLTSLWPRALVLAPTRELALQIQEEAARLSGPGGLRTVALVGGRSLHEQSDELAEGVDIVVATPGRLSDFIGQNLVDLSRCQMLVLDEADRMLDMGFGPQVDAILPLLPKNRQTMLYTATWKNEVQAVSAAYLKAPVTITIARGEINNRVVQRVEQLDLSERIPRLVEILKRVRGRTVVFCNQRQTVETVSAELGKRNIKSAYIHGSMAQHLRESNLMALKDQTISVLIATDVVGRGIDVPDIAMVVNYELPKSIDTYVHRIGRTGRAGKSGEALSFVAAADSPMFPELISVLKQAGWPIPEFLR